MLSETLKYEKGVIFSHYSYGMIDMNEGNYNEALTHFNAYVQYFSNLGDSSRVAKGLYCIGLVYNNLGDDDKNLAIQLRIMKIYERGNEQLRLQPELKAVKRLECTCGIQAVIYGRIDYLFNTSPFGSSNR